MLNLPTYSYNKERKKENDILLRPLYCPRPRELLVYKKALRLRYAFCALKRMYLPITDSLPVENKGKILQWIEEISERIYVILFREKLVNIT